MYNDDNNTDNNGSSIYGKFRERLRKIRIARMNKQQQNKKFVQEKLEEIKKEKPKYILVNKGINPKDNIVRANVIIKQQVELDKVSVYSNLSKKEDSKEMPVINNKVESKRIFVKENKPEIRRNKKVLDADSIVKKISNDKKEVILNNKGTEIINKIKNSFESKIDELEVLSSELYLLSKVQDDVIELKKVEEVKKQINEIINKINVIIEQYNLYKKNYYMDNVIDIDDNILVDDIINYRDLLNSLDKEKQFVKEYKALEEFKLLYSNLVDIKAETENLKAVNEDKILEYGIRDKKYDDIKLKIVSALDFEKKYSLEIDRQNEYFDRLISKVSAIDSREYITSHMKGIGDLVGQSLKYMGLLILSPLAGLLPGIAMQTLATKNMIGNIYKHLHVEELKHIHYQAIDYDSEINHHLCDINYTEKLIDDTLRDVSNLKEDFMMIYDSKLPGYDDTLKKIQMIENKLIHNQNRVALVKKNLNKSKKMNDDKLSLVKKLNDEQR